MSVSECADAVIFIIDSDEPGVSDDEWCKKWRRRHFNDDDRLITKFVVLTNCATY